MHASTPHPFACLFGALALSLGGCSGGEAWPSLNAALPDPAIREKAFLRAEPSQQPRRVIAVLPEGYDAAEAALEALLARLATEAEAYEAARAHWQRDRASGARWRGAQIALTRLSLLTEELNPIADTERPTLSTLAQSADAERARWDRYLTAERIRLERAPPNSSR